VSNKDLGFQHISLEEAALQVVIVRNFTGCSFYRYEHAASGRRTDDN
jgi:hypothetical protein